jgi:drug/metabolite transporter (DMT)-like permease
MWIAITLAATVFQIARTSEQHRLKAVLNPVEAGYVRFAYALPIALTGAALWFTLGPNPAPETNPAFWVAVTGGGIAQILGTVALLVSFRQRDFAIGTVYAKTEVVFVALASVVLLGEGITVLAALGALLCLGGVASLATNGQPQRIFEGGLDPALWFGMAAGLGFALAAVGMRAATTAIEGTAVDRSIVTLTAMLAVQTAVQGVAIGRSRTSSVRRVTAAWRQATGVAVLSLAGSAGWTWAIALENATRVRTLGQVEVIAAFVVGIVVHHEQHSRSSYVAAAVTMAGIGLVVVG